jgi:hypothetical protein
MQEELPYHNPPNAMYLALRAPHGSSVLLSDTQKNACQVVHTDWDRVQRISEGYRRGQLRGITAAVLRDVVVVGSRCTDMAFAPISLTMLYLQDPTGKFPQQKMGWPSCSHDGRSRPQL